MLRRDGLYLVIRRAAGISAGGQWCFPGGGVEPGESTADAVVREMREEVGLCVQADCELWQWTREDGKLRLSWWQLREKNAAPLRLNKAEAAEARWVTAEQLYELNPMTNGNQAFLAALRKGTIVLDEDR